MEESLGSQHQNKFHLISLGCARNRSDSEVILGAMQNDGWKMSQDPEESEVLIVNTCGFIESAKKESIESILDAGSLKRDYPNKRIVVAGCLSQRYKTELVKQLPEVDLFVGTDQFPSIPSLLKEQLPTGSVKTSRTNYLFGGELPKVNTLSQSSAYVKVAEGCQHHCSFCIIPAIRGPLRSRAISSVVAEARNLIDTGVCEINLIAQDLAAYGRDSGEIDLLGLLMELVQIEELSWIRMLYVYPENIDKSFLDFWAKHKQIVPYIDIPVQHASNEILRRMNRDVSCGEIERTIARVRERIPDVAIRTSVMVGFPGESDKDFEELLRFIERVKFDHLGCFTYSRESGTQAARLSNQVAGDIAEKRYQQVMEVQQEVSAKILNKYVGRTLPVLVSGLSEESELLYEGRLEQQAPEVDGVVYVNDGNIKPGVINMVKITEAHTYDLVGHVVDA